MDVIPFQHTWPYERVMEDIYFDTCPKCGREQVLTHLKPHSLKAAFEGVKTSLNLPCCHATLTILHADDDYLWTNEPLRK
ncbi:hypothetical protein B0H94_10871 [Salsuginibacillus halophilus]|uniref:Uncharacterized protein n=1 Tax=Salsuginibacillus halophilus TaxID=517424 RepID=A0A2P8HE20_9BACI|nr:hypothetical protein [Salsuginibacillus halophilus]PSL44460.1 hypothetical protein B0H94_10871 [Salsuginibacillus halophilus]